MVTLINTKNSIEYQRLFEAAKNVLKSAASETGIIEGLGINVNDLEIATLNQYFAYLKDLIAVSTSEDIKRYFTRLPLDEEFLDINADTREIKIPSSFARNGVGVQGDEMAEVVYFKINRYFDAMDLASNDMNIIIQWEAKDADKQAIIGISPNYGKDIETSPGDIIFGWPIYSELTKNPGTIKFAVRFFSFGEVDPETGLRTLNYSLATLPAELSIGATLDYDLISGAVKTVDRGNIITGRIKSSGVHDASSPIPGTPDITTPLYAIDELDPTVRVVDLPVEEHGTRTLAIAAKPHDFGAIIYDWKQWPYNPVTGDYSSPNSLTTGVSYSYEEVTSIGDDVYYRIENTIGTNIPAYMPVVIDDVLESTEYNGEGFTEKGSGATIKLYKRLSQAEIENVGLYTVNVGARYGTNYSVENVMAETVEEAKVVGIKVPGPYKPVIATPEPGPGISVTEDGVTHIIVNNGSTVLAANATKGEIGKSESEVGANPQVTLTYNWKKIDNNDVATDVIAQAAVMPVAALPIAQLPNDGAWLENTTEDDVPGAKGIWNQEHVSIAQNGDVITLYVNDYLKEYTSTNEAQGTHQWVALDIDSGAETVEGVTWDDGVNETYTFVAADENELGIANGHILFWIKADEAAETPVVRAVNDRELTFRVIIGEQQNINYSFNSDASEISISGLSTSALDETYRVDVTATRNKISTTQSSGNYRITNAPEKPVLKYLIPETGAHEVQDYMTESAAKTIYLKDRHNLYNKISFSVEAPTLSDNLSYIWMRANIDQDNDEDWKIDGQPKLQVDIDNALTDLFEDKPGAADFPVDGEFVMNRLTSLGQIIDNEDNGPVLHLSADTVAGYYYCIVINELNNNRAANVSPFFHVVNVDQ